VVNSYEFTLESLAPKRLKTIVALVKYIDFRQLAVSSPNPTAAGLATLLERITHGSDSVASGIVADSVAQLGSMTKVILRLLADIVSYQRERYKLRVREAVASEPETERELSADEAGLDRLRRLSEGQDGLPFSRDLAAQVLEEDYGANPEESRALRREALARLAVREAKEQPVDHAAAHRSMLMDALKSLAAAETYLKSVLGKLESNAKMLESKREGLMERLRRVFSRAAGAKERERIVEVEYLDEASATTRTAKISLSEVSDSLRSMARLFSALGNRMSNTYRRVESAAEDQLYGFLNKQVSLLMDLHKKLGGLGTYFRSEVPREKRANVLSLTEDLAALRAVLIRVNKQKHEYVSRKEEEEQFRRLGISV